MLEIKHKKSGEVLATIDVDTLAGADLQEMCLENADLGGMDLSGAQLSYADLVGADLRLLFLWEMFLLEPIRPVVFLLSPMARRLHLPHPSHSNRSRPVGVWERMAVIRFRLPSHRFPLNRLGQRRQRRSRFV